MEKFDIHTKLLVVTVTSCYSRQYTTLWGEPDRILVQKMEQLHAYDCHQNVTEPQATENHIEYTHMYTGTVTQA